MNIYIRNGRVKIISGNAEVEIGFNDRDRTMEVDIETDYEVPMFTQPNYVYVDDKTGKVVSCHGI